MATTNNNIDHRRQEVQQIVKNACDQLNAEGVNSRFFEPGPQHPEFEDTPKRFVAWYLHALAGDFSVIAPTPRAHRTSACEVGQHITPSEIGEHS